MNRGNKKRRDEPGIALVGSNIRKYRKLRGLTITELANLMDVDYSQVSRMELGSVNTNISMVFAVARVLDIQTHLLFQDQMDWSMALI